MKLHSIIILLNLVAAGNILAQSFTVDSIAYEVLSSQLNTVKVIAKTPKYAGEIVIPDTFTYQSKKYTITSIGDNAFNTCDGLTAVSLPNSITVIGYKAFRMCTGLTSVTIPNSVITIEEEAFIDCWVLSSVTISNAVTTIKYQTFKDNFELKSIVIPNSVTEIEPGAFSNCTGLESVSLPDNITEIDGFHNCSALTSIEIPNSVIHIGYAFSSCTSLTTVIIGSSAESIWSSAFDNCNSLETIYCNAVVPPFVHDEAFYNVVLSSVSLYVPEESINDYKTADVWKEFNIAGLTATDKFRMNACSFYPNPVADVLKIAGLDRGSDISVYSMHGMLVRQLIAKHKIEKIDFSTLPTGEYIIKVGCKDVININKVTRN